MFEAQTILVYLCWACGATARGCPDCVVSVLIDPETGLPPDLRRGRFGTTVVVEPTEEAIARSVTQPICDDCVRLRNVIHRSKPQWPTEAERHKGHTAGAVT